MKLIFSTEQTLKNNASLSSTFLRHAREVFIPDLLKAGKIQHSEEGFGVYKGQSEPCFVLTLSDYKTMGELARFILDWYGQESVLLIDDNEQGHFITFNKVIGKGINIGASGLYWSELAPTVSHDYMDSLDAYTCLSDSGQARYYVLSEKGAF